MSLLGSEQYKTKYRNSQPNPQPSAGNCRNFNETGFQVCGKFLAYWQSHGGLAQQGLPISAVFEEKNAPPPAGDGKIHQVQYFERARFEDHGENSPPADVLLGLLGGEQVQLKYKGKGNTPNREPITVLGYKVGSDLDPYSGNKIVGMELQISNNSDSPIIVDLRNLALISSDDQVFPLNVPLTGGQQTPLKEETYPGNSFKVVKVVFVVPNEISILDSTIGYLNQYGVYTRYQIY